MPKKRGISHLSRAILLLELKSFQQEHPDGCTVTRLNQRLRWRSTDTQKIVGDLVDTGMIYGDYLSEWTRTHLKGTVIPKSGGYLLKVSPWGDQFLKHWEELNKLSTATDHSYSEFEYDLEQEEKRRSTSTP